MRIQHNIMAMNANRNLTGNNSALSKNLEKLSSGYKINRAGDDAAGLAISEKMRSQIAGLQQAQSNSQSGINLVQTAEGAMTEVHDMLNRMVTLATQAANGTYEGTDRSKLQSEINSLTDEINRIAENSNFNGTKLLNGDMDTTGFVEFKGDKTTSAAGVNLKFTGAQFKKADGTKASFKVSLTNVTAGSEAATIDDAGNLTIKIDASTDYTAGDIAELIGGLTTPTNLTGDAKDSFINALNSIQVYGSVEGVDKSTSFAAGGTATNISSPTGEALKLQIGSTMAETIEVGIETITAKELGIEDLRINTTDNANKAIEKINMAIEQVSGTRSNLGAIQNRLEHTINNLGVMEENIQDAESNIRDTNVAEEMMAYTKNNILIQSAQAMLAQANQVPQGVLQLMG